MIGKRQPISLYFHIPFCTKKCDYCHFFVLPNKEPLKDQLLEGLHLEWLRILPQIKQCHIVSIYFGGGTPYLFGHGRLRQVMDWIRADLPFYSSETEVTLEANPENITVEGIKEYAATGINRVSIGVQTLEDPLLISIGRTHNADKALSSVEAVFNAGIKNITIDLMYDLPGQTLKSWETTLKHIETLPISHLSLYNLTIEPHTQFFKKQEEIKRLLPDENTSLEMYEMAIAVLESFGLQRYEISAFCLPGYISRHNTGYWQGRPFLGLGPSAFSYWKGKRFSNCSHLGKYLSALQKDQSPIDFEETLSDLARKRELFAIQLRLRDGIQISIWEKEHGPIDQEGQEIIAHLIKQQLLSLNESQTLSLTQKGTLFYDTVASELIIAE